MSASKQGCLNIYQFDMKRIPRDKVLVFVAQRNSGKSILVLDYLYHWRSFPFGIVVSPTNMLNGDYKGHVPNRLIFSRPTPELLIGFLRRQFKITKDAHKYPSKKIDPHSFIVFDDCLAEARKWKNDDTINTIFMNGRHASITFIITLQDPMGIPPKLRTNVDYVFMSKEVIRANRKKLYDHYAGMFDTFQLFEKTLMYCTEDYRCLVIDKGARTYALNKQVFWYKAKIHPKFRLCYEDFWVDNDKYEEKDDVLYGGEVPEKRDEEEEYKKYLGKRHELPVLVKMHG